MLSKQGCDDIAADVDAVLEACAWTDLHNPQRGLEGRDLTARDGRMPKCTTFRSWNGKWPSLWALGLVLLDHLSLLRLSNLVGHCHPSLSVILLSGLGTLAFMEVTGKGIDIMTIVLPTIILWWA